jgi:hypothetical protein
MTKIVSNIRGEIGILTSLVMGLVLVMSAFSLVLTGISSRANALILSQSENALISTEGCAEEALVQLSRNHDYAGGPISLNNDVCDATVQGSGDIRTLSIVDSLGTITHNLLIQVSLAPGFRITQWTD